MRSVWITGAISTLLVCLQTTVLAEGATWARIGGGAGDGFWSDISKWQDNSTGKFAPSTDLPGENDTVRISHNRTVYLDVDASVRHLLMVTTQGSGTLNLDTPDKTLAADIITVVQPNAAGTGELNLSAGTLQQKGSFEVNNNGALNIDGGTLLGIDEDGIYSIEGAGTVELTSGLVDWTAQRYRVNTRHFLVGGGTIDIKAQVTIGFQGSETEFRVVGDQASIHFDRLAQGPAAEPAGTFYFELNESGVSTINVGGFMTMSDAKIVVDGSAYTGGPDLITLFDSLNLASKVNPGNIEITGFDPSLEVEVLQDEATNSIQLSILR